jgi:hypothetical protein
MTASRSSYGRPRRPLGEALLALFCGLGVASRFVPVICFSMLAVGIFLPLV